MHKVDEHIPQIGCLVSDWLMSTKKNAQGR
jgi:hypothetical protein